MGNGEQAAREHDALFAALHYLQNGDSIPMVWAVEHGAVFRWGWMHSDRPDLLLRIASYCIPYEDLTIALIAVVRTVLPLVSPHNPFSALAIEVAEAWANGQPITRKELFGAYESAKASERMSGNDVNINAAESARRCISVALSGLNNPDHSNEYLSHRTEHDAGRTAETAIGALAPVWLRDSGVHEMAVRERLSNLVRGQLSHRDIRADLLAAFRGRHNWHPSVIGRQSTP